MTKDENQKPKNAIEYVKDLTERINQIVIDYDEKFVNSQKEYDSLVAELHKYCILNVPDYENTELYKQADKKMGEFDKLFQNN